MTLEDKLRFLADRAKDEKEFYIDNRLVQFRKGDLMILECLYLDIINLNKISLRLKPSWEFTEEEKVILENIKDEWKWIVRDEDGSLRLYNRKPYKIDDFWAYLPHCTSFDCFAHLFQSVQWEDDEPCEFREYI